MKVDKPIARPIPTVSYPIRISVVVALLFCWNSEWQKRKTYKVVDATECCGSSYSKQHTAQSEMNGVV